MRVHLAPIGFEVMRVFDPIISLRADIALLLTYSKTDRARFYVEKIKALLDENRVKSMIIECNIWSTSEVVNEVGSIVNSSPQHEYFFNVSTGPRTASIAGTISGMFWQVRPYYVSVNDLEKPVHSESDFPVARPPQFIPTFEIPLLEKSAISALEYLAITNGPVSKGDLLSYLKEKSIIGPRQKSTVSPQALHGQLDSLLQKLSAWGSIEQLGRGKQMRIGITENGIEGRKMFFHMLNPRKPLTILLD